MEYLDNDVVVRQRRDVMIAAAQGVARNFVGIPRNMIIDKAEQASEEFVTSNEALPDDAELTKQAYKVVFFETIREQLP